MSITPQFTLGRRHWMALGAALGAVALLVFVFAFNTGSDSASAATGGPEMALNIDGGSCDDPQQPTKCDVLLGVPFTLSIDAVTVPVNGYILMQTFIDYGSTLVYKPAGFASDEVVWPDAAAAIRSEVFGPGRVSHGSLTGVIPPLPKSNYTGPLVEIALTCSVEDAQTVIELLPAGHPTAGTSGALFTEFETLIQIIPIVDSLTVNCVGPVDTVTETIGTGGGTVTTGTGGSVETDLDIPPNSIPDGTVITINVFDTANVPNLGDAQTFSLAFFFEPDGLVLDPPGTAVITYLDAEVAGIDETTLDVMLFNGVTDQWELAVVLSRDPDNNSLTIEVSHFSNRLPVQRDADQDGCPNEYELRLDPFFGGLRDMTDENDFYDVQGGNGGPPDRIIDLPNDILGVIQHFAPILGDPNYDVQFDRGPKIGPYPWSMGPPDGVIDLPNDILGVIQQFNHNCQDPPA